MKLESFLSTEEYLKIKELAPMPAPGAVSTPAAGVPAADPAAMAKMAAAQAKDMQDRKKALQDQISQTEKQLTDLRKQLAELR
jgi:hypothetical protein